MFYFSQGVKTLEPNCNAAFLNKVLKHHENRFFLFVNNAKSKVYLTTPEILPYCAKICHASSFLSNCQMASFFVDEASKKSSLYALKLILMRLEAIWALQLVPCLLFHAFDDVEQQILHN